MHGWEAADESSGYSWLSGGPGGGAGTGNTRPPTRNPVGEGIHLPTVTTPSKSTTKWEMTAVLGGGLVIRKLHVSLKANLHALKRKPRSDSHQTQQSGDDRPLGLDKVHGPRSCTSKQHSDLLASD